MSTNTTRWLTGCGIGCAFLAVALICFGALGYHMLKNKFSDFSAAESTLVELEETYGQIEDYRPEPNGAIEPHRMDVFLKVRSDMATVRAEFEADLELMEEKIKDLESSESKPLEILGIIWEGFDLLPAIGRFNAVKAQALLNAGMGGGEYCYIYVLAYYVLLEKSPDDGPMVKLGKRGRNNGDYRRWINRKLTQILENQLKTLQTEQPGSANDSWKSDLEAEIAKLSSDPDRLPWQEGLPKPILTSLLPYRDALEESYSRVLNPLELGPDMEDQERAWQEHGW